MEKKDKQIYLELIQNKYIKGTPVKHFAKEIGISALTMTKYLKELNVYEKYKQRVKSDDYIGKSYNFLTILKNYKKNKKFYFTCKCKCGKIKDIVANKVYNNYTKSCGCITNYKEKDGKLILKYDIDFFKTLTPESAYILGLIYTDGNLLPNGCTFSICFHSKDLYMLEKIQNILKAENCIQKHFTDDCYYLKINNKIMYNDLLSWGLYPNKSLTLTVDDRLKNNKDFWKGVIDGDGCIQFFQKKKTIFSLALSGTVNVCNSFKEFCSNYSSDKCRVRNPIPNHKIKIATFTIGGSQALSVLNELYQDSVLHLDRKYKKYQEFKNFREVNGYKKGGTKDVIKYDVKNNCVFKYSSIEDAIKDNNLTRKKIKKLIENRIIYNGFYYKLK